MKRGATPSGYAGAAYAASLAEWGTPRRLPRCDGWVLERSVRGAGARDAMGCYPLFACGDWSRLAEDLAELEGELVSLALVADPFGSYDRELLDRAFSDFVVPFKKHFVIDLTCGAPGSFVDVHHQRNARRALGEVEVEITSSANDETVAEWARLYANLTKRKGIRGLMAFSEASFARQIVVPGALVFRATHESRVVGMNFWYVDRDVGYYHLGAYSDEGYNLRASFALFWRAIEHFAAAKLTWLCLGAGAGLEVSPEDGLTRFKRGWATDTRTAYFCGKILNQRRYEELTSAVSRKTGYFPSYRSGEFG